MPHHAPELAAARTSLTTPQVFGGALTAGAELAGPQLTTGASPLAGIFLASGAISFGGELSAQQPLKQGQVQGLVHLGGLSSGLGGYVTAGDETHFLGADGSFSFPWPGGVLDIGIHAPRHLSVIAPGISVAPNEVLTIPELTLPFGDANGDGRIDILDLSIAAANFGSKTGPLPKP
ncbi:MAG: hypothetical protein FJ316_00560 [SAR202 cluster bacterium]|nr:hypothetical protein [SAR202 cluster bacterium]